MFNFFKKKNVERRNADFEQAVIQLADLVTKGGSDSDRQIDLLSLFGYVNADSVSKDAAIHLLGIYARARTDMFAIYHNAMNEFDARITETVNCSLEEEELRVDAFLLAYANLQERIDHELRTLAQTSKSSSRQREVTSEFYEAT